jgi:hypothetical protein
MLFPALKGRRRNDAAHDFPPFFRGADDTHHAMPQGRLGKPAGNDIGELAERTDRPFQSHDIGDLPCGDHVSIPHPGIT